MNNIEKIRRDSQGVLTIDSHPKIEGIELSYTGGGRRTTIYVDGVKTSISVFKKVEADDDDAPIEAGVSWASHSDHSIEMCEQFAKGIPFALEIAKSYRKE